MRTFLKWLGIAVACVVVCVVLLFVTFAWWGKSLIAQQASAALGRKILLEGDLDVEWSWTPRINIEGIRLANTAWSPEPFMGTLQRLSFHIDLREMLQGRVVIHHIDLLAPVVRLESSERGIPNWLFFVNRNTGSQDAGKATDETALPSIGQVVIHDGRFSYHDYSTDKKTTTTVTELRAETTAPAQAITVRGEGQWETQPFQLAVHAGALSALQASAPYPLQAQLRLGRWRVALDGTLTQPLQLAGVDLDLILEGAPPDASTGAADTRTPKQPLYWLKGHLTRQGNAWALEAINGSVGKNHLAGRVTAEMQGVRPFFHADFSSRTLDVDHLVTTLTGRQSRSEQGETKSGATSSSPTIDLQVTRAVHGVLRLQSQTVKVANQTLQDMTAEARLEDGRLTLSPTFNVADGTIRAKVEVEDREGPLQSAIQAGIEHVHLEKLLASLGKAPPVAGVVQGEVALAVSGRTLVQLLESVDGKASLTMTDKERNTHVTVKFATYKGSPTQTERFVDIAGEGRMRGQPLHLKGRVGSLYALHEAQAPYPVEVDLQLGETQARLDGTVSDPRRFTGLRADIVLTGPNPATLSTLLPVSLPHLPAYQVEGDLSHADHTWTLKAFKGSVGKSDLEGTLVLDTSGEPLSLRGELRSQRLQLDELTAESRQQEQAEQNAPATAEEDKKKRAIPDIAIDPDLLRRLNAELHFQGEHILGVGLQVHDVSAALQIRGGELKLTPRFGLSGGTVGAQIEVIGRAAPMKSMVETTIKGVDLSEVLREFVPTPAAFGELDGHIALSGIGHSLAAFLASAHGDVSLSMVGGRLNSLLTELVGLDLGETIVVALMDRKDTVHIRCLIADFIVSKGKMQTQALLVDTSDTKIEGEGFIDVGEEVLSLKLVPRAKDFSLFSAEAPLYIKGTFSDMAASPKLGEVLLSLATPIKPGKQEDANCQELVTFMRQQGRKPRP
jgi:AsmA family protein